MKQTAVLFCLYIFLLPACNTILPEQYEFYYYPSKNIYYDVSNAEYIYSIDGGKNWDSTLALTDKEPATLGAKQIIKSKTQDIWVHNAEHIQQYNGQVVNVLIGDSVAQEDIVAERKVKKAVKSVTAETKEPEKKPGFFKRLFGKKNK